MNKRELYESIMRNVAKEVKKTLYLNEAYVNKFYLTSSDTMNLKIISNILNDITAQISDWMLESDENEDSETAAWAHILSNIAAKMTGEWEDEITIK